MSLPAKERFYKVGLNIPINRPETPDDEGSFEFTYSFLDSGRTFDKTIKLTLLGQSNSSDMIKTEDMVQMIATDQFGELYQVAVSQGYVVAIRDVRTKKM